MSGFLSGSIPSVNIVNIDKNAPESVHLCRWPQYSESSIDNRLEEEMELAYKLVQLGRAARNSANIKNRQPLGKILLSTKALPDYYGDIIKDELNIKEIELGADLSKYVNYEIKPNLPVLGKAYGRFIPAIRQAISGMNQMELAQKIQRGETVTITVSGTDINFNSENLQVTMQGLEGFTFAGEGEIGVVLDTLITDELREEGFMREIVSKVQNMRKDSGFEVTDKIKLYVAGNSMLEGIAHKFADYIKGETLALDIVYNAEKEYTESNINGEKLNIAVEVVK
jgi:isoleucyl-tRNA synthetase